MTKILIIILVTCVSSISYSDDNTKQISDIQSRVRLMPSWSGESFTTLRYNNISGNTSQAFLKENLSIIEELQINGREKIDKDSNFSIIFRGRTTNDDKIGAKKFGLLRFTSEVNLDNTYIGFGDVSPESGEFIISQGIKGLNIKQNFSFGDGLEISAFGGNTSSNWEQVWAEGQRDYKQYSFGTHAVQQLPFRSEIGLSYISSFEDEKSAAFSYATRKNSLIGWNFSSKIIKGMKFDAEIANSFKNYDDNRQRINTQSDYAYRTKLRYNFDTSTFNIKYYRVEPNFDSLIGSASSDSEQVKTSYRYEFTENINSEVSYNFRKNNLRGQKTATTKVNVPEITSEWKIDEINKLNFDARTEFRKKDDATIEERNLSLSPKFDSKLYDINYNLNYEFRYQEDRTTNQLTHRVHLTDVKLKYPLKLEEIPLTPSTGFGVISDKNTKINTYDITYNISAGINTILLKDLNVDISHQISKFDTEVTGGQGSVQNTTTLGLNYIMPQVIGMNTESGFEWSRRDLKYTGGGGNDYTENAFSFTIKTKF